MKDDYKTDTYNENTFSNQDEDFNEDLYEEIIHKVVYRKSSTTRPEIRRIKADAGHHDTSVKKNNFKRNSFEKQAYYGRDLPDRHSRSWSARPRQHDQRSLAVSKSEERNIYYPVAKWEVDYNNKNYIRSKLNKPGGFHRYAIGRPLDWDIEYDNIYYLRSCVNDPKGLHRLQRDIKRKRVPDNDPLADSTGWEFQYGPMFNQQEGDVPYMPEERRVTRGAYRYYGVRRNASDSDRKIHEKQMDFREINKEDFKYGPEFLQEDVQHILQQKDLKIGRGGYRHYDADRNIFDTRPSDPPGIEYRESYATMGRLNEDELSEGEKDTSDRLPFKHTVLKKIVTLGTPPPVENKRYAAHIRFIPGEGSRSFYEGQSLRRNGRQSKKHSRSGAGSRAFSVANSSVTDRDAKKTTNNYSRHTAYGSRNAQDVSGKGYRNQRSSEQSSLYQVRKQDIRTFTNTNASRGQTNFEDMKDMENEDEIYKKFPPHIEERIYTIKKKMSKPEVESEKEKEFEKDQHSQGKVYGGNQKMKTHERHLTGNIEEDFDFKKHSKCPDDHGKSSETNFERYVNKNGSELWVKTEESYTELHHL